MVERFRLIYLKSPEAEKPVLDQPSSSWDSETNSNRTPPFPDSPAPGTFSSQAILNQVKLDLRHEDPKVRTWAVQYLGKADPSVALPLLQEMLTDQHPRVRAEAISSLIKFQNPAVMPLFKKCLRDNDPRVRIAALRGVFLQQEKIDLNILIQFLSDESPLVRRKMATLLGWGSIDGAFPILVEMSKDPDATVRKAALASLTILYPEESEDRLSEAMFDSDPELRKWARCTLDRMTQRPLRRNVDPFPKNS